MISEPPFIQISPGPDNQLELEVNRESEGFAPASVALVLAERDMGMELGRAIGYSGSCGRSKYTYQIKSGDFEAWRVALSRRLLQPAEEAYLERGPLAGEPDFSGLDVQSPDLIVRKWALAYYAANGITDQPSLGEIHFCHRVYFTRLKASLLRKALDSKDYASDVAVRAYARALAGGVKFPPLIVRRSHNRYHLLEGYHRLHAYAQVGWTEIPCVILGRNLPE